MKPASTRQMPGTRGSTPAGIWSRTHASSRSLPRSRPLPGDSGAERPPAGRWRASSWASSSSLPSTMRGSDGSGLAWRRCARSRRRRWLASTAAGAISPCPGFPRSPLTTPMPAISISSAGPRSSSCSTRRRPAWVGRLWRAWLLAPGGPDGGHRPAGRGGGAGAPPRSAAGDRAAGSRGIRRRIRSRALPRLGGRSARARRPRVAALGGLARSDRGRRARHRGPERGHPGAALGRAASGESARRRDGRTAGLRHDRRGRDRAAGY